MLNVDLSDPFSCTHPYKTSYQTREAVLLLLPPACFFLCFIFHQVLHSVFYPSDVYHVIQPSTNTIFILTITRSLTIAIIIIKEGAYLRQFDPPPWPVALVQPWSGNPSAILYPPTRTRHIIIIQNGHGFGSHQIW